MVTDKEVETVTVVMMSGFAPKTAAAPDGRPLALRVSVQVLLFPLCEIEISPKMAVSPGATDAVVGGATPTVPGWAAMTVPIPASMAARRTEPTVAASRRANSGEWLRDDIGNRTSIGTVKSHGVTLDLGTRGRDDHPMSLVRAGPA